MVDNITMIRRGYDAFAAGDMTTLETLLAPDCTWYVAGDNALTATYAGREATFSFFAQLFATTGGTFTIDPSTIAEVARDTVLVIARVSAEAGPHVFDEDVVQEFRLHDGQVSRCRTFAQNGHLFDALIGPAVISLADKEDARRG